MSKQVVSKHSQEQNFLVVYEGTDGFFHSIKGRSTYEGLQANILKGLDKVVCIFFGELKNE